MMVVKDGDDDLPWYNVNKSLKKQQKTHPSSAKIFDI